MQHWTPLALCTQLGVCTYVCMYVRIYCFPFLVILVLVLYYRQTKTTSCSTYYCYYYYYHLLL